MHKSPVALSALALLMAVPNLSAAQNYDQPRSSGNPLSSIFSCESQGNKQAGGAAVGAVLGGLLANSTSGKKRRGVNTVLGAAAGAAAGSYIGCKMQSSDQQRAQAAAQLALDRGENTTWTNPQTGASGRINVVSTQPYDDGRGYGAPGGGYSDRRDDRPVSLTGVRFAIGVQPQYSYYGASGLYTAPNRVNLRARPSAEGQIVGQVDRNESFDALARVRAATGEDWLLAGRNNVAIGYVAESVVRPNEVQYVGGADRNDRGDRNGGRRAGGAVCRTFDQTISMAGGGAETNRYTACQNASGEWVVMS